MLFSNKFNPYCSQPERWNIVPPSLAEHAEQELWLRAEELSLCFGEQAPTQQTVKFGMLK